MAEMMDFTPSFEMPDVESMSAVALRILLDDVQARIAQLDEQEPEEMDSEEYELWGDCHEELEDMADMLLERLEELGDFGG